MKYLVIGSEGFIGKALCGALCTDKNSFVVKIDNAVSKKSGINASFHNIDITETDKLLGLCKKEQPDIVFNLAGKYASESRQDVFNINCFAPIRFLESSFGQKYKIVLLGSAAEYGNAPFGVKIKEDNPLCPISDYGISKACQTFFALRLSKRKNCPEVVLARPFNIIGPGINERFFLGAFAMQIAKIEKRLQKPVIKVGNLESYRDLIPITKVAHCLRLLAEKGLHGESYNLCSGQPVKISEILKQLLLLSKVDIKIIVDSDRLRLDDVEWSVGDNTKLSRIQDLTMLNYDLKKALEETLNWYRSKTD